MLRLVSSVLLALSLFCSCIQTTKPDKRDKETWKFIQKNFAGDVNINLYLLEEFGLPKEQLIVSAKKLSQEIHKFGKSPITASFFYTDGSKLMKDAASEVSSGMELFIELMENRNWDIYVSIDNDKIDITTSN